MDFGIMKVCSKCGEVKFLAAFKKQTGRKYDRRSACKECDNQTASKYRSENSEKIKESQKNYYEANKEKIAKYQAQWYLDNKESEKLRCAEWYQNNKEYVIERQRNYRKTPAGKEVMTKHNHKRRSFGCDPLNEWFEGSHFHHLHINEDHSVGIYIPEDLHRSIPHNSFTWEGMDEINHLAIKFLETGEY